MGAKVIEQPFRGKDPLSGKPVNMVNLVAAFGYRNVAAVIGHDQGSPLAGWCALARPDIFQSVTLEGSVLARNHVGGTAPAAVTSAIDSARKRVAAA